jgi:hypothetical protein
MVISRSRLRKLEVLLEIHVADIVPPTRFRRKTTMLEAHNATRRFSAKHGWNGPKAR